MYYKDIEYYYNVNEIFKLKFKYVGKRFLPLFKFKFKFQRLSFNDTIVNKHSWKNRLKLYDYFVCTSIEGIHIYESINKTYYLNYPSKTYIVIDGKMNFKCKLTLKNKLSLL